MRTTILTALVLSLVIGLQVPVPVASAESITRVDRGDAGPVPASDDIRRVKISVTKRTVRVEVRIKNLRRNTLIQLGAEGAATPEPMWVVRGRWLRNGKKTKRLTYFAHDGATERVRCRGLKVAWRGGRPGTVIFTVPNRCMMGRRCLAGYHSWGVVTLDPIAKQPLDWMDVPKLLYPDCNPYSRFWAIRPGDGGVELDTVVRAAVHG